MDFVIVGLQAWYFELGSNCKNIALELSKHNRVLYINMPLDRRTILQKRDDPHIANHLHLVQNRQTEVVQLAPNLWNYSPTRVIESLNWLPSTFLFSLFNRINNRRLADEIRKATDILGFKEYILFNDNDIFRSFYLKEMLKPKLYIYYSRDNLLAVPYWRKHGRSLEPRHIAKADLGVANSLYLADYLHRYNAHSHYIGQGCSLSLFNPDIAYPVPEDLKDIPHPIIGYVGAIVSLRIDINIILEIARARPAWHIVMVGPEDDFFTASILHTLPNVHFLGRKDMSSLPAYMAHSDVCINPQLVNGMTIGNYPLKIDEYLAMGKPVVATRTATMKLFEEHSYLADTPAEYVPLIEKALAENNAQLREKRIRFANEHTWENCIKLLYQAIANHSPHD
ncbi:glycosyltransferase [Puia sp.]|uniref:glycosyltransferase n=1 Tax=Puia sp. TaxID=2045100 RepID=UPI002F3F275E